ncbi:iron chaperone [Listeria costaricensis]|uniref:iron chaperone n=1 Tax=Listeria costaricensis TaxID=2026604 RepID=UPI000C078CE5|nr:DUF1801 domain-containing protein [Listeria costaricensis]
MAKAENVEVYIEEAAQEAQPTLRAVRKIIHETVPEAEEKISYGVPFYKYYGEFGGFAAYKKHVSVGFGQDSMDEDVRDSLVSKGYKIGKGTFQIKFEQEVPAQELQQILLKKMSVNQKQ